MTEYCCNCTPVVFTSETDRVNHPGNVTNDDVKENIRIIEIHRYVSINYNTEDIDQLDTKKLSLVPNFINRIYI